MKTLILPLLLLSILLTPSLIAQQLTDEQKAKYAEELTENPEIVGGLKALAKDVVYPEAARKANIMGTVLVTAFIGEDGKVDCAEVLKSDNKLLDEAAVNAVKRVTFTPGNIAGTVVKCRVVVPIKFKLG
jgi:periplasmic protein TonB